MGDTTLWQVMRTTKTQASLIRQEDRSPGRTFLISPAPHGLDRTRLWQMNKMARHKQRQKAYHGKTQAMPKARGNSQRRLNRTTRSDPPNFIDITQKNSLKGRGGRVTKLL